MKADRVCLEGNVIKYIEAGEAHGLKGFDAFLLIFGGVVFGNERDADQDFFRADCLGEGLKVFFQ